jgi:hypothetical protein
MQYISHAIVAKQQWLTTMKHHRYVVEPVQPGVLAYSRSGLGNGCPVNDLGLKPPALIGVLIDIAMIT